jgi:sugar phosphate isomerase/epimerase
MISRYLLPAAVLGIASAIGMGWVAWQTHARATKAEAELERALQAQREAAELARRADAAIAEARRSAGGLDTSNCESALDSIRRTLRRPQ